jgi:hypothetical protein
MDLAVELNYPIAAPKRVLLKWWNKYKGMNPIQFKTPGIFVSQCTVEVFDKIFLIMITPNTLNSAAWTVLSLGTLF